MARYLSGLALAFLLIGALLAAVMLSTSMLTGRAARIVTLIDVWMFFGLMTVAALALFVGPAILLLRRWLGPAFSVARAAAAGAAVGPLIVLPVWFLTRESYETLGGLVQFWWRLPMEFVAGALPYAAVSAFFAGWLVAGKDTRVAPRKPA